MTPLRQRLIEDMQVRNLSINTQTIPKKPQTLPIVLSPEEVLHFLSCIANLKHKTILTTCYAAGLRISEAVSLRPTHIDSQRMVIRIEQGKGAKDRYVMLSAQLLEILRRWWRTAKPKDWLFPGVSPQQYITSVVSSI